MDQNNLSCRQEVKQDSLGPRYEEDPCFLSLCCLMKAARIQTIAALLTTVPIQI